jgi:hypothetical protein
VKEDVHVVHSLLLMDHSSMCVYVCCSQVGCGAVLGVLFGIFYPSPELLVA